MSSVRNDKGRFVKGQSYSTATQFKQSRPYPRDMLYSPFYITWRNMKSRCNNPKSVRYERYGGRGVSYDKSWDDFSGFYNDMFSSYKSGLQLDRIDNDGDYTKSNCRWVTAKENCLNRSQTRFFKYREESLTLTDWAAKLGMNKSTLSMRIYKYNWSLQRALETPVRSRI